MKTTKAQRELLTKMIADGEAVEGYWVEDLLSDLTQALRAVRVLRRAIQRDHDSPHYTSCAARRLGTSCLWCDALCATAAFDEGNHGE